MGFNSTGEFRTARTSRWEFYWDMFERDMDQALAISPCSAIRVRCEGETFGGQIGVSYDPSVPPVVMSYAPR